MSDNIIQITEENLRKAVEANDLRLLKPELFNQPKPFPKIMKGKVTGNFYLFKNEKDQNPLIIQINNKIGGGIGKKPFVPPNDCIDVNKIIVKEIKEKPFPKLMQGKNSKNVYLIRDKNDCSGILIIKEDSMHREVGSEVLVSVDDCCDIESLEEVVIGGESNE